DNPIGSAVGFAVGVGGCWVCSMPGVPSELHKMMREQVEPTLRDRLVLEPVSRRAYRSLGVGESMLQQQVTPVLVAARARSAGLANMFVHYRARYAEVQLILEALPGSDGVAASAEELASLDEPLRAALGRALIAIAPDDGPAELP